MRPIEKATLESLQFLVSMHKPESEIYQEKQAKIMSTNYLLLNPIKEEGYGFTIPKDPKFAKDKDEVKKDGN